MPDPNAMMMRVTAVAAKAPAIAALQEKGVRLGSAATSAGAMMSRSMKAVSVMMNSFRASSPAWSRASPRWFQQFNNEAAACVPSRIEGAVRSVDHGAAPRPSRMQLDRGTHQRLRTFRMIARWTNGSAPHQKGRKRHGLLLQRHQDH